ncbi:hypothetical protein CWB99_05785 [Pseudoalteromonas rubra]|uniref:Uncharacterized protein n=1 Tax=Pseudoalteromonas rubra TaxID=43658 RepID=A0A5S3WQ49_9GAMM|nr:DUF3293 domain-containing protein [Pseudoalteromonas rubra]TMP30843.1 hypothetical protein CWB99_05785 [Pseudoalteromonas rubra]TMP34210.1 hypothetical protein CWC00_08610 [Pseudoalteromonas rubra]
MQNLIDENLWQLYLGVWFRPYGTLPLSPGGAIISLWNPDGMKKSYKNNIKCQRLIYSALKRKGYDMHLMWGSSPDLGYRELSVLVNCSQNKAARLAKVCRQKAYYYVKEGQIWLYNTHNPQQYSPLPATFDARLTYAKPPAYNEAILYPSI